MNPAETKTFSRYICQLSRRQAKSALRELCTAFLQSLMHQCIDEERYEVCQMIRDVLQERSVEAALWR